MRAAVSSNCGDCMVAAQREDVAAVAVARPVVAVEPLAPHRPAG